VVLVRDLPTEEGSLDGLGIDLVGSPIVVFLLVGPWCAYSFLLFLFELRPSFIAEVGIDRNLKDVAFQGPWLDTQRLALFHGEILEAPAPKALSRDPPVMSPLLVEARKA